MRGPTPGPTFKAKEGTQEAWFVNSIRRYDMAHKPRIAIPRWRAPTAERTRHYLRSIRCAGGEFALLGPEDDVQAIDGLLLTGGVDVDPKLYGEQPHPETEKANRERDEHELSLLRAALECDLPVLAACRGHQLLNVAFGGSLLQHIEGDHHRPQPDGESRWHQVNPTGLSRLAQIYHGFRTLWVNSRHHQAVTVDRLAPGLVPVACSPDGLVEAMESEAHRWVLGVQWHPERPEMRAADRLFAAFVAACRT
jgi:putative glutamine amidotransferase